MAPKDIQLLIPGSGEQNLIWQKGFSWCNYGNDLEMGRLSWIFRKDLKYQRCPYERETEGDLTLRERKGGGNLRVTCAIVHRRRVTRMRL